MLNHESAAETYRILDEILTPINASWLNMMLAKYQPPPETPWTWYPFPIQSPTFPGRYLVFIPHKWNSTFEVRYAWYLGPPATPWCNNKHIPAHRGNLCVDGVSHWMILPTPTEVQ